MPLTLAEFLRDTPDLRDDFDPPTRRKAAHYAASGRVRIVELEPRRVTARVRGTQLYEVALRLYDEEFQTYCSCPRFTDGFDCKHILAVILELGTRVGVPAAPVKRPSAWKDVLRVAQLDSLASPPSPIREEEILYVVNSRESIRELRFTLSLYSRRRKANGEWTRPAWAARRLLDPDTTPDATDRHVLSLLKPQWGGHVLGLQLDSPLLDHLLPLLARSGRMRLTGDDDKPEDEPTTWDEGGPWTVVLNAEEGPALRLWGRFERAEETIDLAEPALIMANGRFIARRKVSRFEFAGSLQLLYDLRRQGAVDIPPSEVGEFIAEAHGLKGSPIGLPEAHRFADVRVAPLPSVRVISSEDRRLEAAVSFDYQGVTVRSSDPGDRRVDASGRRVIHRDLGAERRFLDFLVEAGFRSIPYYRQVERTDYQVSPEVFARAVGRLIAAGWKVEAQGVKYRAPGKFRFEVSSGVDWFDLKGGLEFGDQVAPFPALLKAAKRGERHVVLGDGTFGLLPEEWLGRSGVFLEAGRAEGSAMRFRAGQAAILDALLEAEERVDADPGFERARRELRTFESLSPADPPEGFRGELRPYQKLGLGWFEFLRRFGWGGCLADDMGLGKTVQALALLLGRRGTGNPSLVVVPRSVVFNWQSEAAQFAPALRVVEHGGQGRVRDASAFEGVDVVLTTYGILRRDAPFLKDVAFDTVILDEAQAIKNAAGATAKAARLLKAEYRLAMSGTPIENHLGELWSLMEFLNPGLLGRAAALQSTSAPLLAKALRPFILRRTKEQVAPELPARIEQTVHVDLEPAERARYDELKEHYKRTLLEGGDFRKSKFHALEALLRLRQAACHGGLVDPKLAAETGTKLEVLIDRLREVVEEGHKALVFSQFTSLLAILKPHLDKAGLAYEYLDGATRDREERVRRFQSDGTCPLFLISLKAGGLGLNLTAAEYVFLLDPWWNPASEAQAIDRAHRIGQRKPVMALRLVARDTVEERVIELQRTKRELADSILNAEGGLVKTLTKEDLRLLLS